MKKTKFNSLHANRSVSLAPSTAGRAEKLLNLKSILVPVDFSPCSVKAVQYAVLLARDYGASIFLVHIAETKLANDKRLKLLDRQLHVFAKREVGAQARVITMVKQGEPLREIINIADAGSVDLLVISTHGRAGLPDFCLGSAAEQIVRYAPCPVLVVRQNERDFAQPSSPSRDP